MRTPEPVQAFIDKWQGINEVKATEISTSQSFIIELCGLLGVATPHVTAEQDYMFERPVSAAEGDGSSSARRIDCYRRGAFVWESKKFAPTAKAKKLGQTSDAFDAAMMNARQQAVADALSTAPGALDVSALAEHFTGRGAWKKRLPQVLETLVAVGRARHDGAGWRA